MRRELRGFLVVCAVLAGTAALLSACSSSSSPSAEQACNDVAAARCQKMQECNPQGLVNTYGDLSTCESRQSATCVTNLAAPQTANSPAHTEACAQATPGQSCSDFALGNVPSACTPPAGPRAAGSACSVSAQCATAYCLISRTSACGVCAAQPVVGDSCANNGCGPGLVCDNVTSRCAAPVIAGGACDDSSACAPGYTCIGNTETTTGSCVALAAVVGASCDVADGGTRCDGRQGLYCNVPEGRICAKVATASTTLECGTVDGGVIDCTNGAFCQKPTDSKSGICIAPAADGTACDTVNGPTCARPSRCVLGSEGATTGTCQTTTPSACN